jgi:hypothetical protein
MEQKRPGGLYTTLQFTVQVASRIRAGERHAQPAPYSGSGPYFPGSQGLTT